MSSYRRRVFNSSLTSNRAEDPVVDWANPINTGMLEAYLCNENASGNMYPMVSPARLGGLGITNYPTTSLSPLGKARNWVAASNQVLTTGGVMPTLTVPFTFFCVAKLNSAAASTFTIFSYQSTTANNGARITFNNSQLTFTLGAVANMSAGLSTTNGVWYAIGWSKIGSGINQDITYSAVLGNGPTIATFPSSGTQTMSGTPNLLLLGAQQSNASVNTGDVALIRIWNRRALDVGPMRQLFENPMEGLILPPRRRFSRPSVASGITFDAAANSGDQAASANYTFSRTVTGTNTFLAVDVELLTVTGATVVSVTDDDGGSNTPMFLIGSRSTVTGAGRVECWGLANPTTGTKTIRVILSASIESVATAVSYAGVDQIEPTEGFNSNQATNVGAADATVGITSVTDQCWIHAACVSDDTTITANQTSRNNVAGTLGSGANEDNNVAVSPSVTTMSYTNVGALKTWAIAGYAIKPLGAADLFMQSIF